MSDIDTGVVVSLKVLDPDGRLEKRTNSAHLGMSALCQKRTYAAQQKRGLFDDLVGGYQQLVRDSEAERLDAAEVDHQLELSRAVDWQITWFGAP